MKVFIGGKLGYCSGVSKAIDKAIEYAEKSGGKVYSLGTLAHNETVVDLLRQHGVTPIKVDNMEHHTRVAITAHGAPPWVYDKIKALGAGA